MLLFRGVDQSSSSQQNAASIPRMTRPNLVRGVITEFSCEPVALNVRGRLIFTITGASVGRNDFFKVFLSGRWNVPTADDGSIFIDSDPEVFLHLLAFFSRGVFPIVFDPNTGHNHKLYLDILAQARYYSAPELEAWLECRCYYRAVSLRVTTKMMKLPSRPGEIKEVNQNCDTLQMLPLATQKAPVSALHPSFEEKSFLEVRKKVCFDDGWCSTAGTAWEDFWNDSSVKPKKLVQPSGRERKVNELLGDAMDL